VVHDPTDTLYEMWRADIVGDDFDGGCLAVWDLVTAYPDDLRGEQCTSADAAGFPIAPLLISPDEVAAGTIEHAIRFILPNPRMRAGVYVRPATHAGGPSGPVTAVPYGARLRLRADYPLETLPNDGARTIARAMQTYGIVLADGGNIALTAQSDRFTATSWTDVGIGPHSLTDLEVSDFEIIDTGTEIVLTYDCDRSHPLLLDGFELGSLWRWQTP
jgi:serine/threonine-protein kinase